MVVDRGTDFPPAIQSKLEEYGSEMWLSRNQQCSTTRALNSYRGEHRNFEYLTPRIRIAPKDIQSTRIARPETLHFICSPSRAASIISEVLEVDNWHPTMIYEPIPDRCVPEELPALIKVLPALSVLSPNAEEALSLLSVPGPPSRASIESAAQRFLAFGIGNSGDGCTIIRSGALGAYVLTREKGGKWIDAYWQDDNMNKVVDVTGAGNSFLGGLAAGLFYTKDVYEAALYATVSASYTVEQTGLPSISKENRHPIEMWNSDHPETRLTMLKSRQSKLSSG